MQDARRLTGLVLRLQPGWEGRPNLVRLVVVAFASVIHVRFSEFVIREHVRLLWVLQGEKFLRAHSGVCFLYMDQSWEIFSGLISDVCLEHIQQSMQALEGILHSLPTGTSPDIESCVAAVARVRSCHADENDRALFWRLRLAAVSCQQVALARDNTNGAGDGVYRAAPTVIGHEARGGAQAVVRTCCPSCAPLFLFHGGRTWEETDILLHEVVWHGVQAYQRIRSHGLLLDLRRRGSFHEGNRCST